MNFKNILKFSTIFVTVFASPSVFAGEIGVSHSVFNSVKSGVGNLTVDSVKSIHVNEKSISFTGQLSGSEFKFGEGSFSGSGTNSKENDDDKHNNKPSTTNSAGGGTLGSGSNHQISATLATRNLSSSETVKSKLKENYSFSDSSFTQSSSTFSY